MNILLIGNGFDLAHELPTKYNNFLKFCEVSSKIYSYAYSITYEEYERDVLDKWSINNEIKETLKDAFKGREKVYLDNGAISSWEFITKFKNLDKFYKLIDKNFWITYFNSKKNDMDKKENWIDFEKEISEVIKFFDKDMCGTGKNRCINDTYDMHSNYRIDDAIKKVLSDSLLDEKRMESYYSNPQIKYKDIRDKLLKDLNKLIRALEIYLTEFVGKIKIKVASPDIKKIINGKEKEVKILCFNYTDTYEKTYLEKGMVLKSNIDYIHGEADINHTIETNNMVLGIDEYLPEDRKNKDLEFIAFKKFYQRIYKGTGCKYKEWIDEIRQDYKYYLQRQEEAIARTKVYIEDSMKKMINELAASAIKDKKYQMHNLYIFGHSLDVTDGDILRGLILNDNVHTTIFYHNKDTMGQQIANLVKVIGQDELIKRTGGSTKTIELKQQQDMIEIS